MGKRGRREQNVKKMRNFKYPLGIIRKSSMCATRRYSSESVQCENDTEMSTGVLQSAQRVEMNARRQESLNKLMGHMHGMMATMDELNDPRPWPYAYAPMPAWDYRYMRPVQQYEEKKPALDMSMLARTSGDDPQFLKYKAIVDETISKMRVENVQKAVFKTPEIFESMLELCSLNDAQVRALHKTDSLRYTKARNVRRVYFAKKVAAPSDPRLLTPRLFRKAEGYKRPTAKRQKVLRQDSEEEQQGLPLYDVYDAFDVIKHAHLKAEHKKRCTCYYVATTAAGIPSWLIGAYVQTCEQCCVKGNRTKKLPPAKEDDDVASSALDDADDDMQPEEDSDDDDDELKHEWAHLQYDVELVNVEPQSVVVAVVETATGAPAALVPCSDKMDQVGRTVAAALAPLPQPLLITARIPIRDAIDRALNSLDYAQPRPLVVRRRFNSKSLDTLASAVADLGPQWRDKLAGLLRAQLRRKHASSQYQCSRLDVAQGALAVKLRNDDWTKLVAAVDADGTLDNSRFIKTLGSYEARHKAILAKILPARGSRDDDNDGQI